MSKTKVRQRTQQDGDAIGNKPQSPDLRFRNAGLLTGTSAQTRSWQRFLPVKFSGVADSNRGRHGEHDARSDRTAQIEQQNPVPQYSHVRISQRVQHFPVRAFVLTAALLHAPGFRGKFLRLWRFLVPFDELWALSPFLLLHHINFGLALACMALLACSPFAQRSLVLMGAAGAPPPVSAPARWSDRLFLFPDCVPPLGQ